MNCREYTKAPEGRREPQRVHESSRGQARQEDLQGPSDDQDDLGPTGFGQLLFLNMFKNSSRSLFRYPTLVGD